MKAIAITGQGGIDKIQYMDVERPTLGPREVLIETRAVALNHLDIFVRNNLDTLKLAAPHVAGADGAGVVAEVGNDVSTVKVGDRVLINPGLNCGVCEFCQAGEQSLCARFGIMGESCPGTFAEYFKVPHRERPSGARGIFLGGGCGLATRVCDRLAHADQQG